MAYNLLVCFSVLSLAGNILAAAPTCKKINDCACMPTDTNSSGVINFLPLVIPAQPLPAFEVNFTSPWVKDSYTYYFNPCIGFSIAGKLKTNEDPCKDALLCQHDYQRNLTFSLGAVHATQFAYVHNILVATYRSKESISSVSLICDETEAHGKFVFANESKELYYTFNFISMCACPGKCPNKTLVSDKWIQTDKCLYRQMRLRKVVNLQGLDTPLKVAADEHTTYYYNPCNGLELDVKCKDVTVCKMDSSLSQPTYTGIGSKEVEVTEDDGDLVLHYPATADGGKCFDVKLICDQSVDDPILTIAGDNKMTLKAKAACPQ